MSSIANLRKAAGYTQRSLADQLQVDRTTVTKWELGISFPKTRMLSKLAEALHTTVGHLLEDSETDTRKALGTVHSYQNRHHAKHLL